MSELFNYQLGNVELDVQCNVDRWSEPSEYFGTVETNNFFTVEIESISIDGRPVIINTKTLSDVQESANDYFGEVH